MGIAAIAWPASAGPGETSVVASTDAGVILETEDSRETCTSPQLVQAFSSLLAWGAEIAATWRGTV